MLNRLLTLPLCRKNENVPTFLFLLWMSIFFAACTEEPPIMPGLVKGIIDINTFPDSATVYLNGKIQPGTTPLTFSSLDPGFYKVEVKRNQYLDTTYYIFVNRGKTEKLTLPLREDPVFWWRVIKRGNYGLTTSSFDCVEVTKEGVVWAATPSVGIWKIERDTAVLFTATNSPLPSSSVFDIKNGMDGTVWIATANGIAGYKNGSWLVLTGNNSNMPSREINEVFPDAFGNVWFASRRGGIGKFSPQGISLINKENSLLPINTTLAIAVDDTGGVWTALEGNGVFHLKEELWHWYTTANTGIPNLVSALCVSGGKLYCTSGGFAGGNNAFFIQNGKVSFLPIPSHSYNSIRPDASGGLWLTSGDNGALYFNNGNLSQYNAANSGLPSSEVFSVAFGPDGSKWFATSQGLAKYIGGK